MKKLHVGLGLVALVSSGILFAEVCSVDSARILQESAEGRGVMALNEKDKKAVMDLEYSESKKIEKLRDSLENSMRAGNLSEEAMQEKYEEFGLAQRKAKQAVENAREDAGRNQQKRIMRQRVNIFIKKVL
jgi:Skp family chaperone for outer membrane proteins